MNNQTISGIFSVLGGRVGELLISVVTMPVVVRILGSSDYGDYAFLISIFAIITTFAHAGISAGIRKYMVEERNQEGWKEHVFAFYTRLALVLALVGGGGLVLFSLFGLAEEYFGTGFSLYFILLTGMLVTNQLFYVFRYTLMGLHLEQYSESLAVLRKLLFAIFGLGLAYIGLDIAGLLVGTILAFLVCVAVALLILRTHIDMTAIFRPLPADFPAKNLFSFNAYNTIFVLATISLYNIDLLLLQPIAGSQETGLYKAALVIAEFLWLVPIAVQTIFIQSSSEMWSRDAHEEITSMASKATRYTLIFTTLLLIGVAALATPFMTFYFGSEFSAAVTPLLLLLPGVLGFAVARPIYAIGQGKGELRILIIATGVSATINLGLNLLLIPRYGMSGAAVSTSIGYGSMVLFHYFAARQIGYNPFNDLRLARVGMTVIVAAPIIFGAASVIDSRILSLLIVPPVGFAVYSTLALRTGAISADEIIPLLDRVPSPISQWSINAIRYLS